MNKIKREIDNYKSYFNNSGAPLERKSIYLVSQFAIPIALLFLVFFHFVESSYSLKFFMFGIFMFQLGLGYLLYRFDETDIIKYVIAINTNILMFPTIYILTGDINNGAVLFFPLGIIITFFLIKERAVYIITAIEVLWYVFFLAIPALDYEKYHEYRENQQLGIGIIASFISSALVVVIILAYQTILYNRSHEKFVEAERVIEEAESNKSRFLANMTHEIRTPMNSIIGMNELIAREELTPEARELAEQIRRSSNSLLKIINNILEYSKLESNKMNLYLQKYDFSKLMTEIINAVSADYEYDNNELNVSISPNIPSILFGDSIRIKQVFMYVLFSAIRKIPNNRITLRINGEIDRTTNSCLLSCTISETGLGLNKEQIDAMMSAFARFDSRQKNDFQGMGLELSICSQILKLMGGSLRIESIEDVGMAIKFEFINYIIDEYPIAKLDANKELNVLVYCKDQNAKNVWSGVLQDFNISPVFVNGPNAFRYEIENRKYSHIFVDEQFLGMLHETLSTEGVSENTYVISEKGRISDNNNLKIIRNPITCINISAALNNLWEENDYKINSKKEKVVYPSAKVLIVDDSIVNLKVLEGILSTFKINVTKAKSGEEALSVLREEEFDLLIYDQKMPGMDGTELLHLTKEINNANALIPVICATADFGTELAKELAAVGFKDYLAKPIRKHYLERMLREYLPVELAENVLDEENENVGAKQKVSKNVVEEEEKKTTDPFVINFDKGLANIAGNMEAFGAVVLAYYNEGVSKLEAVPAMLQTDLALYTIEVHALKSSSAAIGAEGISDMFKSLEFAGRSENREFLEAHTGRIFADFEKVLEIVKKYLIDNNLYVEKSSSEPEGEAVLLEKSVITEILEAYGKFNLKFCEDKLAELVTVNYGADINASIKAANDALAQFDYHKMKDELTSLNERL